MDVINKYKIEALKSVLAHGHKALEAAAKNPPSRINQQLVHRINTTMYENLTEIEKIERDIKTAMSRSKVLNWIPAPLNNCLQFLRAKLS